MVLKIDPNRPESLAMERAAAVLAAGDLVAAPTETRYGLFVRADRQASLQRLYETKQRPLDRPTALLIDQFSEAERYGRVNCGAAALAERFMPGPVTLVLAATCNWPPPMVIDGKIGLRCSSSPVVHEILSRLKVPIAATSANISGQSERDNVSEIVDDFDDRVALYLDAGPLTGPASTVIDCSTDQPRVLREGAVAADEITRVMDELRD